MNQYVPVVDDEADDPIELPVEDDGTLLISTLAAQFTGACGLKYRNPETQIYRGVRLTEDRLHPPEGKWTANVYTTVYPKEKRKGELSDTAANRVKRGGTKRCSDLIVLGLPWKSTEEDLRQYFSQFGELIMVQVKRDPVTKQSKGFGFIRFNEYDAQLKALSQRHNMDGRWCDLRIPNSKEGANLELQQKIYVGRLTEDVTADDLRNYFSQFGEVTEVYLPKPFRAFAFVSFSDPEVAVQLCGDDHILKGISIHVGSATPKGMDNRGGSEPGWGKGRFGGGGDDFGAVGTRGGVGRGGRGYGGYNSGGHGQNFGGFGSANQMPLNSAMMAAAQAAIYGFMSQAAAGGGVPGFGGAPGGAGGNYGGFNAPAGGYGNTSGGSGGNYNQGGGYGASRYSGGGGGNVSQSGGAAGGNVGAYTTSNAGQSSGATGGGAFNGSGVYVPGIDMDGQAVAGGSTTNARWN